MRFFNLFITFILASSVFAEATYFSCYTTPPQKEMMDYWKSYQSCQPWENLSEEWTAPCAEGFETVQTIVNKNVYSSKRCSRCVDTFCEIQHVCCNKIDLYNLTVSKLFS